VTATAAFSFVAESPAAAPGDAQRHFLAKLSVETDPSDLHLDLERCPDTVLVVDARSAEAYAEGHIPGSISLPHRGITAAATAALPRDRILVSYCWGPSCNASTKAAARLAGLGFRVKELIGGIEYWRKEGYPVETGAA
jgi:rhodanese-related sulfurtransferase